MIMKIPKLVKYIKMTDSQDKLSRAELIILIILATIQFVSVLDFVIIMPLGPQFMRVFQINPKQFGVIVSSYTFSASIFGLISAFFLDKFDRKKSLLLLLSGFCFGTFLCAIAPTYLYLVIARIVAGAFGGVMAANIFAIVGDVIVPEKRGRATGMVMSGFALASIMGIPIGLYLANLYDWHSPFYMLVICCMLILFSAYRILPSMTKHLEEIKKKNAFNEIKELFSEKNHLKAFSLSGMLTIAGFTVTPYLSPYLVANVGLSEKQLPYTYLIGGFFTLFTAQITGKLADKYGKLRIFILAAFISIIPVLILTNLPRVPVYIAICMTTFFMIAITGRVIPSTAMITGSVKPEYRGGFMSVNSSIQNLGSGIAAFLSGSIIDKTGSGLIINYDKVGIIASFATMICIYISTKLDYDGKNLETPTRLNLEPEV